jgi:outer membrane protein assembly factor BamB
VRTSLKAGEEGRLLWNITFTPPSSAGNLTISMGTVDPEDGVFLFSCTQTRTRWGYSLATGQQLWESEPEEPMKYYGMGNTNIYQGMLLSGTYLNGGILISYNITTGEILWKYEPSQIGFESPFGDYPAEIACIADGKIYIYSSPLWRTQPLWRGSYLRCINASNGAELWKVLHYGAAVIADGFLVGLNYYDNQIYCYGKGPSATTVSAPQTVPSLGSSVMITGTVTDECVGAKRIAEKVGFTNGVPAVSDESMEAWMEWLYAQQGKPMNATGVDVSLDTVDPNGNYVHIATVTSDLTGAYGYKWTPEVPGTYQIIATFAGSAAYYGSFAQAYVGVNEAPTATAPPEYPQPIDPTMTIVSMGIVLLIAIVIVGILLLRKK